MYSINAVNLEITDRCQAACPMCARNCNGGSEQPHVQNIDVTLDQIKQWFPVDWIKTIKEFNFSGNNGDPIIAKEVVSIVEFIIANSDPKSTCRLYTNGSLRTKKWWSEFAKVLNDRGDVVFAIDGFEEQHSIYRRNTDWNKIIENAKSFISAGGHASANIIVFKHNEHIVHELKSFLLSIGFETVAFIFTPRFLGEKSYPVKDKQGNIEYYIEPPTTQKDLNQSIIPLYDKIKIREIIQDASIKPQCHRDLYIDPLGNVFPCSSMHRWINTIKSKVLTFEDAYKDISIEDANKLMSDIGYINLKNTNIKTALENSKWDVISKYWQTGNKNSVCVATCSDIMDSYK